ncbi:MAG: tRNA uridine-5-carboxymethylaminomethyl(34) synthesis GTPase MnmE, partial [Oscillospiraceae bacterium]
EFTKRALLNGKMSLTQAESVSDMISSQNKQAINSAKAQMDGALYKKINNCKTELLKIAGAISAYVDYPEDDIPEIQTENLKKSLTSILKNVDNLVKSYDSGKLIRQGIETVIVGKPNVGKSTLMNLLVGEEKSIVTEIAGTTRDIIEETVILNDIMLKLSDTAGIRETGDTIEKMGVNLAKKRLENASLVLAVFDGSTKINEDDLQIISAIGDKPCIAIINKNDLSSQIDIKKIKTYFKNIIEISAKNEDETLNNSSLIKLENEIKNILKLNNFDITSGIIVNERQRECIILAQAALVEAENAVSIGMTLDAVEISIESAIDSLLELTGERITVEVVNQVFSHFCVGK